MKIKKIKSKIKTLKLNQFILCMFFVTNSNYEIMKLYLLFMLGKGFFSKTLIVF